jgi:hypothetical protein
MYRVKLVGNLNSWELLHELYVKYLVFAEYGDEFQKLTKSQMALCLTYEFDKEVKNGGIDQYFFNSSGNYTHETVKALQTIGAAQTSALLQECINVWPDKIVPKDWENRRDSIQNIDDEAKTVWEDCTGRFYKGDEIIPELLFAYIDSKPEEFE